MDSERKEFLNTVLERLNQLKEFGPSNFGIGICPNIKIPTISLTEFFESWPKYSGRYVFPITIKDFDAGDLYVNTINQWDKSTEYGQLRWELVDHMINEIEKELANDSN